MAQGGMAPDISLNAFGMPPMAPNVEIYHSGKVYWNTHTTYNLSRLLKFFDIS